MKNRLFTFLFFSSLFLYKNNVLAQTINTKIYSETTDTSNYGTAAEDGMVLKLSNQNLFGFTNYYDTGYFFVANIDHNGNVVWRNKYIHNHWLNMVQMVELADSSVALLFLSVNTSFDGVVVKIDFDGNVEWAKALEIGSGGNFEAIAPTTDGGMIIVGGGCSGHDMNFHIDSYGNIVSQSFHDNNISALEMIGEGNNNYSGAGIITDFSQYPPFCIFRFDSAGKFSDCKKVVFPNATVTGASRPHQVYCRTNNGGHIGILGFYEGGPTGDTQKNILFCFDDKDNFVWAKKIFFNCRNLYARSIIPTSDNGCLLMLNHYTYKNKQINVYMKFSEAGDLETIRAVGDTTVKYWDFLYGFSIIPRDNDRLNITFEKNGYLNIAETNSDLDGFCYYTSLNPVITNLTPSVTTLSVNSFLLSASSFPLTISLIPQAFYLNNGCSNSSSYVEQNGEVNDFNMFPNPFAESTVIKSSRSLKDASLSIYNTYGQKVKEITRINGHVISLSRDQIENGIYFYEINESGVTAVKGKMIVE